MASRTPAADAAKGALAGLVGMVALDLVSNLWWKAEGPALRAAEEAARPEGLDPAHRIANRAAATLGKELHPRQPHPLGEAVHVSLGVLPGALYGLARRRFPVLGAGAGLLYGAAIFLLEDEGLNPLLGNAAPPGDYPREAHARGLFAHLAYGLALHAAFDVLDRKA